MKILEYTNAFKDQVVPLMALLQDYEADLHPSRPAGKPMAESHFEYLLDLCAEYQGKVFVAEHEGSIAGFIVVHLSREDDDAGHVYDEYKIYGDITDLAVAEACRRQGVAKALIDHAEAYVKALGVMTIQLTALAKNTGALALYKECGFETYEVTLLKKI